MGKEEIIFDKVDVKKIGVKIIKRTPNGASKTIKNLLPKLKEKGDRAIAEAVNPWNFKCTFYNILKRNFPELHKSNSYFVALYDNGKLTKMSDKSTTPHKVAIIHFGLKPINK